LLRFMAVPLGCLAQVYGGATWLPCSGLWRCHLVALLRFNSVALFIVIRYKFQYGKIVPFNFIHISNESSLHGVPRVSRVSHSRSLVFDVCSRSASGWSMAE